MGIHLSSNGHGVWVALTESTINIGGDLCRKRVAMQRRPELKLVFLRIPPAPDKPLLVQEAGCTNSSVWGHLVLYSPVSLIEIASFLSFRGEHQLSYMLENTLKA